MPAGLLLRLAVRNLARHRRRTLLLVLAICIAVAGVTFLVSLLRGMQYDMRDAAVGNLTGHIKILAPGYLDDPDIRHRFALDPGWSPALPADELAGWAARIRVPAVIMSERETRGVTLVGVDPAREDISFLGSVAVEGERLVSPDDGRVLIGRALAGQLETGPGYRLVVITQGADGRNRETGYRIAGIYDAEGSALEKVFVFTGMHALQRLLDTADVTEVSIRLKDRAEAAAQAPPQAPGMADESLPGRLAEYFTGLDVLRWQELEPQAAAMFAFADSAVYIWFLIIMSALVFGLVNALVTAVLERTREFGMLRAVGMRPSSVIVQVVAESALIMLVGLLLGVLLGALLVALCAEGIDLSRWSAGVELGGLRAVLVPRLYGQDVALVAGLSLGLAVAASLYPAWRAVRMKPVEALRR